MKIASYCRVSTDKDDQANSFAAQQRYFREYIEHRPDWELFDIYADEGITGTSTKKRTQFNRMITDAYEGKFQMIITKEVSRFSRNILDAISYTRELKDLGVGVLFMIDGINTLNPDAELHLSIMASMAQEESRKISSRVVWGQTRQMEKGVVFGRSLLGYDVKEGNISVNPEGAEIVRLIFRKYALEQVSTSEIARFLTEAGYHTYRGGAIWKANTLVKILMNEKYVGDLVQKKSYTPDYLTHKKRRNTGEVPMIHIENHHEPIISREVWNIAQNRLRNNNKHGERNTGHSNRYVFSGKIKCGACGSSFVGRMKCLKDGTRVRRWCCGRAATEGAGVCKIGRIVRDDDAVQMLKTAIQSLQIDKKTIVDNVTALVLDAIQSAEQNTSDDPDRLQYEMNRTKQKKEALMDSFFSGDITKEEMLEMKHYYDEQLETLGARLIKAMDREEWQSMKTAVQSEILSILNGETDSTVFCKTMLHSLSVFKDRHMELRLNHLSQVFHFA